MTHARINLFGVLRVLEQLAETNPATAEIVQRSREIIQFSARGVGTMRLAIGPERITHHPGAGPASIKLGFGSGKAVNAMFDGTGNPIPLKGITRLSFLTGDFTAITSQLEAALRPTPEELEREETRRLNTLLTLHLAVYALAEIGNHDPAGQLSAQRIADGDILLAVEGGPQLTLNASGGRLKVHHRAPRQPRARMVFANLDVAGAVLRGELASYTAIGRDEIMLGGFVPMLDNMNKLLGLVPRYLA